MDGIQRQWVKSFDQYHLISIPYASINKDNTNDEIESQKQQIINELNHLPDKDIIILLNVEELAYGEGMIPWCNCLTSYFDNLPSVNYIILTNNTFEHADNYSRVLSVNWFLHETVCVYSQTEVIPWEPTNTDVLFLPGKPWKPSRLPALDYFLRSRLNSNLKYSSLTFEEMMEWHGEDGLNKIIASWNLVYNNNNPLVNINIIRDIMNKIAKVYDLPWHDDIGFRDFKRLHPKMYSNICVEIISETAHNNEEFITEKTYKPIVLGYPFVFIHDNFLKTILGQGFEIFQPQLSSEFDNQVGKDGKTTGGRDWEKEFETCIKNTEEVVNNTQNKLLKEKILGNQQNAMKLHQETINNIAKIIPNFNSYAGEIFCSLAGKLQKETQNA